MADKILVVDDDQSLVDLITRILRRTGYEVSVAHNGLDALAKIELESVDLVLLDVTMPELDGFEVCKRIKENETTQYIPVALFTGMDDRESRMRGYDAGADEILTKPFDQSLLLSRIRSLLRIKGLREKLEQLQEQSGYFGPDSRDSSSSETVQLVFDFPESIKVSCQQYLLYFVEFLRDVGVEASASLQELAGKTLFSVTPKDKDEALDNIREALDVYLHLPIERTITPFYSPETSIEVQRLSAQVLHLQSQLMLASAAYQQKELANQQQTLIIQQQQSLIQQQIASGQVLLASLQRETEKDEAEPVGTTLVRVTEWKPENIPLQVDLPEIMRRLKEKFSRKQLPPDK